MQIEYSNHPSRQREIPEGCPPEFRARIMEIRSARAENERIKAEDKRKLASMSLREIAFGPQGEPLPFDDYAARSRERLRAVGLF